MHEVVVSDKKLKRETGVQTLDVAKRLMDYGFHPPTVYFPLVVPGALMIEPTETESKETIDEFAEALLAIAAEAARRQAAYEQEQRQEQLRLERNRQLLASLHGSIGNTELAMREMDTGETLELRPLSSCAPPNGAPPNSAPIP